MSFYSVAGPLSTNSRDPGTTIRSPSTALLGIDSEDRYKDYVDERINTNLSPFDFTITKPENIMAGFFTRVGVTEVVFPWVVPNVNVKSNKIVVSYSLNGAPTVDTTITIATGFYTPEQLAEALTLAIGGIAPLTGNVVVRYGIPDRLNLEPFENDYSFSYEVTGGTNITIGFSALPYNSAAYPYPSSTKQLFDVLGFNSINTVLAAGGVGDISFAQWTRYVDIVCNQLTLNQALKDAASQPIVHDMLARLYVSAAPGQSVGNNLSYNVDLAGAVTSVIRTPDCFPGNAATTIYKDYQHPKQIQWLPNQNVPGYLRFVVYDDSGAPLQEAFGSSSPPSVNWSLTCQFSEN